MTDQCTTYLAAVSTLMESNTRLERTPQPWPPTISQLIKSNTEAINTLEAEYLACRTKHPLAPPREPPHK